MDAVPPYSFSLTVHKPAGWPLLTPFEIFKDDILWTGMRFGAERMYGLKLRSNGTLNRPSISCQAFSRERITSQEKTGISDTVTWMLRTKEDLTAFYSIADHDPLAKTVVQDLCGMRDTLRPDIFPTLTLAVTLQMAPMARSNQMMNLLTQEFGEKIVFDGKDILYWPSPETIAKTSVKELEKRCKLGYRAKTLKGIAQTLLKGFPTLKQLEQMSPEEAKAKLMELRGIGDYSADIVTPHAGFPLDVWSAKIFHMLLLGTKPQDPRDTIPKLKKTAEEKWGKWRGYLFTYVLNDLDKLSKRLNLDLTEA